MYNVWSITVLDARYLTILKNGIKWFNYFIDDSSFIYIFFLYTTQ